MQIATYFLCIYVLIQMLVSDNGNNPLRNRYLVEKYIYNRYVLVACILFRHSFKHYATKYV